MILVQKIIDLLFLPFAKLAPGWGLAFATFLITGLALLIYKYTSSQKGIKRAKEKIKAHFVEVWLYIDDPILILKAQGRIFLTGAQYLGFALVPLLIMFLPVLVFLINCEHRYHYRAFHPSEKFLLKLKLSSSAQDWRDEIRLELPPGLKLNAPPLRIQDQDERGREFQEIDYQLLVQESGEHQLKILLKNQEPILITIFADPSRSLRLNPVEAKGFSSNFWHPGLGFLNPKSQLEMIEITYPKTTLDFFRWKIYWVWPFLILMFLFAFALKPILKVEF